jgi:ribosomal protein S8
MFPGNGITYMTEARYTMADFSPHLFWDVDRTTLDWEKNKFQIIKRVLEYGLIRDWELIRIHYGVKEIGQVSRRLRSLDKRAALFISSISGIPVKSFRCYSQKQPIPPHWNF